MTRFGSSKVRAWILGILLAALATGAVGARLYSHPTRSHDGESLMVPTVGASWATATGPSGLTTSST